MIEGKRFYGFTANIDNVKNNNQKKTVENYLKNRSDKAFCHNFEKKPQLRRVRDEYCSLIRFEDKDTGVNTYMGGLTPNNVPTVALYDINNPKSDGNSEAGTYRFKSDHNNMFRLTDFVNMKNNYLLYFDEMRIFKMKNGKLFKPTFNQCNTYKALTTYKNSKIKGPMEQIDFPSKEDKLTLFINILKPYFILSLC